MSSIVVNAMQCFTLEIFFSKDPVRLLPCDPTYEDQLVELGQTNGQDQLVKVFFFHFHFHNGKLSPRIFLVISNGQVPMNLFFWEERMKKSRDLELKLAKVRRRRQYADLSKWFSLAGGWPSCWRDWGTEQVTISDLIILVEHKLCRTGDFASRTEGTRRAVVFYVDKGHNLIISMFHHGFSVVLCDHPLFHWGVSRKNLKNAALRSWHRAPM